MADIKGTTRQDFPEVKGKVVDSVGIIAEPDHYGIDIRFLDKTGLAFSIEPYVVAFPVYSDWIDGEEKPIKQYLPLPSKGLRSQ